MFLNLIVVENINLFDMLFTYVMIWNVLMPKILLRSSLYEQLHSMQDHDYVYCVQGGISTDNIWDMYT